MNKLYIDKHIKLVNNTVYINDVNVFSMENNVDFSEFAKSVYKHLEIKYSKFYKMDALSKLGFLAAELLLQDVSREAILPEEIALVCANSSSSLHTDNNYQKTIEEIPSPAVFVYTLPNIVLGEICIRNNIKGESMFFIQDKFDAAFFFNYIKYLFHNAETKLCITGWLEMDPNEEYQADLFLVSGNKANLELNEKNINIKE